MLKEPFLAGQRLNLDVLKGSSFSLTAEYLSFAHCVLDTKWFIYIF